MRYGKQKNAGCSILIHFVFLIDTSASAGLLPVVNPQIIAFLILQSHTIGKVIDPEKSRFIIFIFSTLIYL